MENNYLASKYDCKPYILSLTSAKFSTYFSVKYSLTGIPIKTTMDNTTTVQYAGLISQLSDKARSVVRDLDPTNDLTFLRIRSRKHEIMVAPGKKIFLLRHRKMCHTIHV